LTATSLDRTLRGIRLAAVTRWRKEERMKLSRILTALTIGALLPAAPVLAGDRSIDVSPAEPSPASREAPPTPDISGGPTTGTAEASQAPSIEGTVAAIDHDSGRFVLDTDDGPVNFTTTPEELAGVGLGDIVRVSLVSVERNR
jgi:hypothetical protein